MQQNGKQNESEFEAEAVIVEDGEIADIGLNGSAEAAQPAPDASVECPVVSYSAATGIMVFTFNGRRIHTNEVQYDGSSKTIRVSFDGVRYHF